jgi:hypothetical protein
MKSRIRFIAGAITMKLRREENVIELFEKMVFLQGNILGLHHSGAFRFLTPFTLLLLRRGKICMRIHVDGGSSMLRGDLPLGFSPI